MGRCAARARRIAAVAVLSLLAFAATAHAAGGELAFVRGGDVWTAAADGSGQQLLLTDGAAPAWSPDGARIAFERAGQTWVADADGANQAQVTIDGGTHPTWSPDGTQLAVESGGGIFVLGADGSNPTRITPQSSPEAPPPFFVGKAPDWSPDGTRIAMGGAEGPLPLSAIYTISPTGEGLQQYAWYFDRDTEPAWSPDGTRIALSTGGVHSAGSTVEVEGTGTITPAAIQVEPDIFVLVTSTWPAWSPDGTTVLYQSDVAAPGTGAFDVWARDLAAAEPVRLIQDATQPDWRVVPPPPAPDCSSVTADPATLPADGRLHRVTLGAEGLRVRITGIRTDGPRRPRWRVDAVKHHDAVWLRGIAGRTYTVTFRAKGEDVRCKGRTAITVPA